jgi:sterol 3beta-glucosyltransferase
MRIAIVCNDTRGGVQPYVALALGLREAGHRVQAVAPADLAPMFGARGFPVQPLSGDVRSAIGRSGGVAERGALASMMFAARQLPAVMDTWTAETLAGCEGADVITGGIGGMAVGRSVAEKLGAPFVETHLQPVGAAIDAYPGVLMAGLPPWLGPWGRRASHHLSEGALWASLAGPMQRSRRRVLGLAGRPAGGGRSVLYGISRHVVPIPSGPDRTRHATGYWSLPTPADWAPTPELAAFVEADGPVVTIGFGSMTNRDPSAITEMVQGAVRDAGVRAVLVSGWGGLSSVAVGDHLLGVESVPHDWLFARMHAIVHHGGAGTTGAALRAGVPSVVVPFTMDQPFWAARVAALGVGPAPIPRRRLTRERLAGALRTALTDAPMRDRAARLGALLHAEDGVATAVGHFDAMA